MGWQLEGTHQEYRTASRLLAEYTEASICSIRLWKRQELDTGAVHGRLDVLPSVTAQEMREVDRLMVEEFGIGPLQMMEHAGRNLTEIARTLLGGRLSGRKIVVLVGPGNNGGGGMVAARHLANAGASVVVVLAQDPARLREIPAHQYATLFRMGVRSVVFDAAGAETLTVCLGPCDLVIDALLGYSLDGPPRGKIAEIIRQANGSGRPILALDLPSGLHPDTGEIGNPCIRAHATLTLALPKRGLLAPTAKPYVGRLWVGDISVPLALYKRLGFEVGPLFSRAPVIPLEEGQFGVPGRRMRTVAGTSIRRDSE